MKRQKHLSNANLARRGRALGIDRHMRCNAGMEFISDSMVATTMEALLGAAFYNGGLNSVAQMLSVMDLGSGLDAM
jgi:dsRNA-specific ribonuclease